MKKQILFLDVDGVLFDWFDPFMAFVHEKRGAASKVVPQGAYLPPSYKAAGELDDYDIGSHPIYRGVKEDMYKDIAEFVTTEAWGQLKAFPGVRSLLDLSQLKNMGIDLHVISQVTSSANNRLRRAQNLTGVYGPVFSSVSYTAHGQSKSEKIGEVLSSQYGFQHNSQEMAVAMVEDAPHQIEDMVKAGIETYGVKQSYNRTLQAETTPVTWITDISELKHFYGQKLYGI